MKVLISDRNTTIIEIGIYNLNGDEATEAFLVKHFADYPSACRKVTEEEKAQYNIEAEYIINSKCFNAIVNLISQVQPVIDDVAQIRIEKGWTYDESIKFGFLDDGTNFLI